MKKIFSYLAVVMMAITVSAFSFQAKADGHTDPTMENLQYWQAQINALVQVANDYNASDEIKEKLADAKSQLDQAVTNAAKFTGELQTLYINAAITTVTDKLTENKDAIEAALKEEAQKQFSALGGENPSAEVQAIIEDALDGINALSIDLLNKSVEENVNDISAAVEDIYNQAEADVNHQLLLEKLEVLVGDANAMQAMAQNYGLEDFDKDAWDQLSYLVNEIQVLASNVEDKEITDAAAQSSLATATTNLNTFLGDVQELAQSAMFEVLNAMAPEGSSEEVQGIVAAAKSDILLALGSFDPEQTIAENLLQLDMALKSIMEQAEDDVKAQLALEGPDPSALEAVKQKFEDFKDSINNNSFADYVPEDTKTLLIYNIDRSINDCDNILNNLSEYSQEDIDNAVANLADFFQTIGDYLVELIYNAVNNALADMLQEDDGPACGAIVEKYDKYAKSVIEFHGDWSIEDNINYIRAKITAVLEGAAADLARERASTLDKSGIQELRNEIGRLKIAIENLAETYEVSAREDIQGVLVALEALQTSATEALAHSYETQDEITEAFLALNSDLNEQGYATANVLIDVVKDQLDALLEIGDPGECFDIVEAAKVDAETNIVFDPSLAMGDNIDALNNAIGGIFADTKTKLAAARTADLDLSGLTNLKSELQALKDAIADGGALSEYNLSGKEEIIADIDDYISLCDNALATITAEWDQRSVDILVDNYSYGLYGNGEWICNNIAPIVQEQMYSLLQEGDGEIESAVVQAHADRLAEDLIYYNEESVEDNVSNIQYVIANALADVESALNAARESTLDKSGIIAMRQQFQELHNAIWVLAYEFGLNENEIIIDLTNAIWTGYDHAQDALANTDFVDQDEINEVVANLGLEFVLRLQDVESNLINVVDAELEGLLLEGDNDECRAIVANAQTFAANNIKVDPELSIEDNAENLKTTIGAIFADTKAKLAAARGATAIDNTNASEIQIKKVFRNGQVLIIRGNQTFNMNGAVVE